MGQPNAEGPLAVDWEARERTKALAAWKLSQADLLRGLQLLRATFKWWMRAREAVKLERHRWQARVFRQDVRTVAGVLILWLFWRRRCSARRARAGACRRIMMRRLTPAWGRWIRYRRCKNAQSVGSAA